MGQEGKACNITRACNICPTTEWTEHAASTHAQCALVIASPGSLHPWYRTSPNSYQFFLQRTVGSLLSHLLGHKQLQERLPPLLVCSKNFPTAGSHTLLTSTKHTLLMSSMAQRVKVSSMASEYLRGTPTGLLINHGLGQEDSTPTSHIAGCFISPWCPLPRQWRQCVQVTFQLSMKCS